MITEILKEIKTEENHVCVTPAGVEIMTKNGNRVPVEMAAGSAIGFER